MVEPLPFQLPKTSRVTVLTLGTLIIVLLAWSAIGKLDVVVSARGRIVVDGQAKAVQPGVSGVISKILVKEGDLVKAGEVLLELDGTSYAADAASAHEKLEQLKAELDRLEAEQSGASFGSTTSKDDWRGSAQDAIRRSRETRHQERRRELEAAMAGKRAALAAGESSLRGLHTRRAISLEKEEAARPYVGAAIPRFQYLQLKDDVLTLEKDIAVQRLTNARLQNELEESRQRLLQATSDWNNLLSEELSAKRSMLVQLQADYDKARRRAEDVQVRAPVAGYVQKISVATLGATVTPNEVLVHLVPAGAPLVFEALIPNEERGFLREGQAVDIKLDAFPFQKYGRVKGELLWVSPDAELMGNAHTATLTAAAQLNAFKSRLPQYVYRSKIALRLKSAPAIRQSPGLTGQADIATDTRRIIDFFLFPIQKSGEEALRVR